MSNDELRKALLAVLIWVVAQVAWYSVFWIANWTPVVPDWGTEPRLLWALGVFGGTLILWCLALERIDKRTSHE